MDESREQRLAMATVRESGLEQKLTTAEQQRLHDLAQLQSTRSGEEILRQLAPAEYICLPCRGMVIVERSSLNGRRQVMGFLRRGDY